MMALDKLADQVKFLLSLKIPVAVYGNDESGDWVYSVVVRGTDFWLESFKTKDEAVSYCKKYELSYEIWPSNIPLA